MHSTFKTIVLWVVLLAVGTFLWSLRNGGATTLRDQEISYSRFMSEVYQDNVSEITILGNEAHGKYRNKNAQFHLIVPAGNAEMFKAFEAHHIDVKLKDNSPSQWSKWLLEFSPLFLVVIFLFLITRQLRSSGQSALNFGKSRAKLVAMAEKRVTFRDIAGATDAKVALEEITDFLRKPEKWKALGANIPKGCLLVGPPGCGKTLLARAVAGEANVPFFSVSGADFVEMFVGVGAARVRDLFEMAGKNAPCVAFIDELDAVGRKRGSGIGGGHDEREQTLNQLLVAMDGFDSARGVVVLAATNRPDVLDKALIRPGRFDRQIKVPLPDVAERKAILEIHTRRKPLDPDVNLGVIAQQVPGYGGADLENLANQAAFQAVRRSSFAPGNSITQQDFDRALELIRSGREIFSNLDLVLIESATQLAEPMEKLFARLYLTDQQVVEGELLWADSHYIKYRSSTAGHEVIVPKESIWKFEQLVEL